MRLTKLMFSAPTTSWSPLVVVELLTLSLSIILTQTISLTNQASAFHLSFGHRLLKAATNLNPASSLIRPIECRNANNHSEAGICMFSIDCMHNKGVPLSVCKHNYFVGTCCRLPDYNNFVGIVYDLRDTETNQLMEARRMVPEAAKLDHQQSTTLSVGSPISPSTLSSSSSPPSSLAPPVSSNLDRNNFSTATQEFSTTSLLSTSQDSSTLNPLASSSSSSSSSSPLLAPSTPRLRDDNFEADKYVISSTKLFATPTTTAQPPTTIAQNHKQQQQQDNSQQQQKISGESARNADGGTVSGGSQLLAAMINYTFHSGNIKHNSQLVALPSELDSFQIHSELAQSNQSRSQQDVSTQLEQPKPAATAAQNHHQSTYELIKDDNSDILVTVNSVHSPPTTQQHFNIIDLHSPEIDQRRSAQASTTQADKQSSSSVYMFVDQSQQSKNPELQQQSVVFSNNHQLSSSSSSRPVDLVDSTTKLAASSMMTQSDQEFALSSMLPTSTVINSPTTTTTSATTSASTSTATPPPPQLISTAAPISGDKHQVETQFQTNSSQAANSSASIDIQEQATFKLATISPFVDLVSSNSASQSTTPFTTSLSTAILPNVSSHPYSPTTQTPNQVALVSISSSSQTSLQSSLQTSSSQTSQTSSEGDVSSLGFNQLYSNQHSGTSPQQQQPHIQAASSPPSSVQTPSNQAVNRPNFGILGLPQMASKIVTGTSSSNNFIPGLNGLQSAILSHIPFKISGLSSGLSNYLQSAAKPFGSRPLLSSNNAPALQYQQQLLNQQQQQNKSDSSAKITTTGQAILSPDSIRFPGPSSSSVLPPSTTSSSSSFMGNSIDQDQASTTGGSIVSWQVAQLSSSTTTLPPVVQANRDVVKEAQLVCGRPKVSQVKNQAENEGGKKRVARIVGGNQSSFGQWPWMVSLRQWRKGAFLHKCGAALLNENWAITAAHCVENVKVTDLLLRLGEFDVSNQAEPYPYIERRVKSVVSHPSFDPKTFEYDLALLRFAEPIKYERNILPVCVPTGNDSYVDRMATVIGWGRLYEDGPLPDVIQHVDVPIITNNECEKMYKNAGYIEEIPDMFICAGISKGGRDSCEGDSGGPLTMVDHDGRSYLVGIISWGIGCALPSQPGVYTRITAFSGWINQITAF